METDTVAKGKHKIKHGQQFTDIKTDLCLEEEYVGS